MPATETRIANSPDAQHGPAGEGVAADEADSIEVQRMNAGFQADLRPSSKVGRMLVLRLATMAVRMERCVAQENAAIARNVRKALDEFKAPEGVDARQADRLRSEAADLALFDTSKAACQARRYEAAAERAFHKALKEFREVEGRGKVPALVASSGYSGSYSPPPIRPVGASDPIPARSAATPAPVNPAPVPARPTATPAPVNPAPSTPSRPVAKAPSPAIGGYAEVPFSIGRVS